MLITKLIATVVFSILMSLFWFSLFQINLYKNQGMPYVKYAIVAFICFAILTGIPVHMLLR